MSNLLLMGIGQYNKTVSQATSSAANPQLQFFENFPGRHLAARVGMSQATLSIHAVNIPLSISFNNVLVLNRPLTPVGTGSASISFGLYSLNGSSFSLANSASVGSTWSNAHTSWMSMITSATQNITPGAWYFAIIGSTSGGTALQIYANSSINPGNAIPGAFLMGRMTASTAALPASIATSDLDITGSDATRQPLIIITA